MNIRKLNRNQSINRQKKRKLMPEKETLMETKGKNKSKRRIEKEVYMKRTE